MLGKDRHWATRDPCCSIPSCADGVRRISGAALAINCAISAFHVAEWIWGDWLNADHQTWRKLKGIRDRSEFLGWIDGETQWFKVRRTGASTLHVEDDYVEPGQQEQYLEIEIDGKWTEAIIVIEELVMFWEQFS